MSKLVVFALALAGCGGAEVVLLDPASPVWDSGTVLVPWAEPEDPRPDPDAGVPADVQPYVDRFVRLWGQPWGDVPVRKVALAGPAVGVCTVWSSGHRSIDIDSGWWAAADVAQREVLVFHEAGHCHLGRDHDPRLEPVPKLGQVPVSLMYPMALPSRVYSTRRGYYRAELFDRE